MLSLVLAAQMAAAHQWQAVDVICLRDDLKISTPARTVIDFKLVNVYARNNVDTVLIYIGYNPQIGPKNAKYKRDEFQNTLAAPIKVDLQDTGILGVPNKLGEKLFHISARKHSDAVWVAERVEYCATVAPGKK